MKNVIQIVLFWGIISLFSACQPPASTLSVRQERAEQQLSLLAEAIRSGNMDSVWLISQDNPAASYYVYGQHRWVFWSDNSIALRPFEVSQTDKWIEVDFDNARCLCRWMVVEGYQILAVIPVEWHIHDFNSISDSFSFRALQESDSSPTSWWQASRLRAYYIICLLLIGLLVALGIFGLIKARGFRNLRLLAKVTYLVVTLIMISFVYIFVMSVRYVRRHYQERQISLLQEKTLYIQSALQNTYYWSYELTAADTRSLNINLRDLAYTFGTDINVYDLQGRLIGSSTPQLFEQGFLSNLLSPKALFTRAIPYTGYEQVGSVRYLASYTDFLNISYVRIGYIGVPSFISTDEVNSEVDAFLTRLLPPYILIMLIALLISVVVVHSLTKPLSALSERMSSFRLGKEDNHIYYAYEDEVGELVKRYNAMVDELEDSARKLAQSEREGAWRTMARQIAHEINNPLTPMKLTIQQLQRVKGTERFEEAFDRATSMLIEQIDNLSRIATSFSSLAKMPEVKVSEVAIADKLTAAIALHANNPYHIPIRYVGPDNGVWVQADPEQVGQVFTNILRNAVQALENRKEGDIIVMLKERETEVEISFSDNGPGIPAEIQEKIFTPNFTTKSGGSGLGLAISKNIVEASGGQIRFTTSPKGTTFYVTLHKIKHIPS